MRAATRIPAAGGSAQHPIDVSGLDINLGLLPTTATSTSTPAQAPFNALALASHNNSSNIEDWFTEVLASAPTDNFGASADSDAPHGAASSTGYATTGVRSEQETPASDVSSYEFTPGSVGGQGDEMEMEMDRLLDLLPSTTDGVEDFQGLLASMMDNEKVSTSKIGDDWNWELTTVAAV